MSDRKQQADVPSLGAYGLHVANVRPDVCGCEARVRSNSRPALVVFLLATCSDLLVNVEQLEKNAPTFALDHFSGVSPPQWTISSCRRDVSWPASFLNVLELALASRLPRPPRRSISAAFGWPLCCFCGSSPGRSLSRAPIQSLFSFPFCSR